MRTYLDHNATTPLRPEARAAMIAAMDVMGNPSSVHAEGRKAKLMVERARVQVADLVGCLPTQVIFTGSATEAAALAVAQKHKHGGVFAALSTEHDCLGAWRDEKLPPWIGSDGTMSVDGLSDFFDFVAGLAEPSLQQHRGDVALIGVSAANSETGILQSNGQVTGSGTVEVFSVGTVPYAVVCDITQLAGKMPVVFGDQRPAYMILSAHKLGGPKGVGAFINLTSDDPTPILIGGGQEMNRRSGTENTIGIAGFGAAAAAAAQDVAMGRWEKVAELRNILERALEAAAKKTIFVGNKGPRLPNTSCILTEGWKGETQVMQMDLAGFAISAGSACSSGKVKESAVLRAMGYDAGQASCAIRVSLGLETTEEEILRFAETWATTYDKHQQRAA